MRGLSCDTGMDLRVRRRELNAAVGLRDRLEGISPCLLCESFWRFRDTLLLQRYLLIQLLVPLLPPNGIPMGSRQLLLLQLLLNATVSNSLLCFLIQMPKLLIFKLQVPH